MQVKSGKKFVDKRYNVVDKLHFGVMIRIFD